MLTKVTDNYQPIIRPARLQDTERISNLSKQLGYSIGHGDIRDRLRSLKQDDLHIIYVASWRNDFVVGWIHAHKSDFIIVSPQVLIFGLIVDINYRRRGIARLLVQKVEEWALIKNCQTVRLRSNITRKDAHNFYENIGYKNTKHSLEFSKNLI
ncbi:GNAT family N-acetyltransferase [Mastigocoleus testarum]|uniref:N-acetyltransferase domain-containing protein n=1 Tax=Mastigocoleus testarum BC008 TaxID=371196 RepID=A0A0V7ZR74_9CYAN|nr:GNAT family N-acetyltransferase [Mastigocoleus testarum]KST67065.1 hypothetical protein BC008_28155 [Mastigocoleus testarum BC008]